MISNKYIPLQKEKKNCKDWLLTGTTCSEHEKKLLFCGNVYEAMKNENTILRLERGMLMDFDSGNQLSWNKKLFSWINLTLKEANQSVSVKYYSIRNLMHSSLLVYI